MEGATSIDGAASEQVIGFLFQDRPAIITPSPPPPFCCLPSLSFHSYSHYWSQLNISFLSPLLFSSRPDFRPGWISLFFIDRHTGQLPVEMSIKMRSKSVLVGRSLLLDVVSPSNLLLTDL